METIADSRGTGRGPPEQNPADSLACSGLRTQGSAQVRAVTAQVQRRKRILVGKIVGRGYNSNLRRHLADFVSNTVSWHRRSAQALLTLASGCLVTFLLSFTLRDVSISEASQYHKYFGSAEVLIKASGSA
jgi:hypothetical protein